MPLLLADLDNTLVDRDGAFRAAVSDFLAEHRLPEWDLEWVMSVDASGYASRQDVAQAMMERYGPSLPEVAARHLLDNGAADRVVLPESTRHALDRAVSSGWSCVIVTNGRTAQQEAKIRNSGLDRLVNGWVASEAIGHKKPEPEIFWAAAGGTSLDDAWVVGDSPHTDIAGAHNINVRSVWVSGGRPWTEDTYWPTHVTASAAAAIDHVVSTPG